MHYLMRVGMPLLALCCIVLVARGVGSKTLTATAVDAMVLDSTESANALALYGRAAVSVRDLSTADRRRIAAELLENYKQIHHEVSNKIALDLFAYEMFCSEVDRGNAFYARAWLKRTHWDGFNSVLVENVLARSLCRCDPLPGVRVLLSLAWDEDAPTRNYARFVLHRAFFDLLGADASENTLDNDAVDRLESRLLESAGKWTVDPTYTDRWEQTSFEMKAPGRLLLPNPN